MGLLRLLAGGLAIAVALGTAGIVVACMLFAGDIAADLARLTAAARSPATIVTEAMLAALPPPAQRYLRQAGVVGKPIPAIVRLTQTGRIHASAGAAWMAFEADETYSTNPPAFVWRAWLPGRMLPVALGRDEYLEGRGSILIKLLGLVPLADAHGDELAAAGLMRYLNESMWFPSVLLAPGVSIGPAGPDAFRTVLTDRGRTAEALFFVDADGRLANFRAQRFNTATQRLETWETPIGGYRTFNGSPLPASGTAIWNQPEGDLPYIDLEITSLTYD